MNRYTTQVMKYQESFWELDGSIVYGRTLYMPVIWVNQYVNEGIGTKDGFTNPRKAKRVINRFLKGKETTTTDSSVGVFAY